MSGPQCSGGSGTGELLQVDESGFRHGVALLLALEWADIYRLSAVQPVRVFPPHYRCIRPEPRPGGTHLRPQPLFGLDIDRLGWMLGLGDRSQYSA